MLTITINPWCLFSPLSKLHNLTTRSLLTKPAKASTSPQRIPAPIQKLDLLLQSIGTLPPDGVWRMTAVPDNVVGGKPLGVTFEKVWVHFIHFVRA